MLKHSLADAKAHLSALVDRAEHHGERILILRHGKPAAAIVPVDVADDSTKVKPMSQREIRALLADAASCGSPTFDAVGDLLSGRR